MFPEVMQDECEKINVMMLEETVEGVEAYNEVHEGHHNMGIVYLPSLCAVQAGASASSQLTTLLSCVT